MFPKTLKIQEKTNNQFLDYLKNPSGHSMFLKETELGEAIQILKSLNIKKSTDMFGISHKMTKIATKVLKTHIATLFNY